jgi:holliday junction DNA helicase RuvA
MIAYLSGMLLSKQATSVIVDVGGIGYEVTIPLSTFYEMEETGSKVSLRIYTHVREDTLQLFGFNSQNERDLFVKLISVTGIGPKSAIAMLSGMSAVEIVTAIRTNNLARLTSIPGVGKKTGERLVIELRDKVKGFDAGPEPSRSARVNGDSVFDDTLSALLNFGYPKSMAEKAVNNALAEGGEISVELLLRRSLKTLSKG